MIAEKFYGPQKSSLSSSSSSCVTATEKVGAKAGATVAEPLKAAHSVEPLKAGSKASDNPSNTVKRGAKAGAMAGAMASDDPPHTVKADAKAGAKADAKAGARLLSLLRLRTVLSFLRLVRRRVMILQTL